MIEKAPSLSQRRSSFTVQTRNSGAKMDGSLTSTSENSALAVNDDEDKSDVGESLDESAKGIPEQSGTAAGIGKAI